MARIIQYRCVFVAIMLGAFAGLLAGRFDPSSSFDWLLVFIPLWIVDLVCTIYLLRDFIRVWISRTSGNSFVTGNVGGLWRTAWLGVASILLAVFKALIALRLNTFQFPVSAALVPLVVVLLGSAVDIILQKVGLSKHVVIKDYPCGHVS